MKIFLEYLKRSLENSRHLIISHDLFNNLIRNINISKNKAQCHFIFTSIYIRELLFSLFYLSLPHLLPKFFFFLTTNVTIVSITLGVRLSPLPFYHLSLVFQPAPTTKPTIYILFYLIIVNVHVVYTKFSWH